MLYRRLAVFPYSPALETLDSETREIALGQIARLAQHRISLADQRLALNLYRATLFTALGAINLYFTAAWITLILSLSGPSALALAAVLIVNLSLSTVARSAYGSRVGEVYKNNPLLLAEKGP